MIYQLFLLCYLLVNVSNAIKTFPINDTRNLAINVNDPIQVIKFAHPTLLEWQNLDRRSNITL
jgi:hypothetical protein